MSFVVITFFVCLFYLRFQHMFCFSCSEHQQNSYYEASDNVYEDVENINKFFLGQNSRKRKGGLKSKNVFFNTVCYYLYKAVFLPVYLLRYYLFLLDPYADSQPMVRHFYPK